MVVVDGTPGTPGIPGTPGTSTACGKTIPKQRLRVLPLPVHLDLPRVPRVLMKKNCLFSLHIERLLL